MWETLYRDFKRLPVCKSKSTPAEMWAGVNSGTILLILRRVHRRYLLRRKSGHTWMSEGPHDDDDIGLRIFSAREVRAKTLSPALWVVDLRSGMREKWFSGGRLRRAHLIVFE